MDYLKDEISSYKVEADIWKITGEIKNPPGNLCLHICGNLNNYLGMALGKTGYIRNRDLEFSKKDVSREELLKGIDETKQMIENVFVNLNPELKYPDDSFGPDATNADVIFKLIAHLNYHLGQINYHRRILNV